MKWVTRERPVIDRIACPWLIARFIDKEAEFLFVPPDRVKAVAEERAEYQVGVGNGHGTPGIIAEIPRDELARLVKDVEGQMKQAARDLEFEKAALLRDQIVELRRIIESDPVRA